MASGAVGSLGQRNFRLGEQFAARVSEALAAAPLFKSGEAATRQPAARYYDSRMSNAPVAGEQLATSLGAPLVDFAWVGATTEIGNSGDGGTPTSFGTYPLPGPTF